MTELFCTVPKLVPVTLFRMRPTRSQNAVAVFTVEEIVPSVGMGDGVVGGPNPLMIVRTSSAR